MIDDHRSLLRMLISQRALSDDNVDDFHMLMRSAAPKTSRHYLERVWLPRNSDTHCTDALLLQPREYTPERRADIDETPAFTSS